jgi:hypothetical protein
VGLKTCGATELSLQKPRPVFADALVRSTGCNIAVARAKKVDPTEQILINLATMEQSELVEAIMGLDCDFPIDFTPSYLHSLTAEKLRHVYMALKLYGHQLKMPVGNT